MSTRRRLLHEIEDRWLHRGAWPPWIIHSLTAAPFVLAIVLTTWLGMNYATLAAARGQAFRSLQAPLVDVINFALKYPAADYKASDFVSVVLPLEQMLLNPAISRDKNLTDLRAAIDRVRHGYCLSGAQCESPTSPPRPSREEVEALHSAAAKYLESTYSSSFAGEYFGGQGPMLTAIAMLVILGISLLWWQPMLAAKFGAGPGDRQYHIQGS